MSQALSEYYKNGTCIRYSGNSIPIRRCVLDNSAYLLGNFETFQKFPVYMQNWWDHVADEQGYPAGSLKMNKGVLSSMTDSVFILIVAH